MGRLNALNPNPGDLRTHLLCNNPLDAMEEAMKKGGWMETSASAVEYLRANGVLE